MASLTNINMDGAYNSSTMSSELDNDATASSTDDSSTTNNKEDVVQVIHSQRRGNRVQYDLYIPSFAVNPPKRISEKEYDFYKDTWGEKDWLTSSLIEELQQYLPQDQDIDKSKNNQRNKDAFNLAMSKMFYSGRIFASAKQLHQAVSYLAKWWAFESVQYGKYIGCSFTKTSHKYIPVADETKRRKQPKSLKDLYQCPFKINFSYVNYSTVECKKPSIMYRVKVTSTCFEHTCNLDTEQHRIAIQKSGRIIPENILPGLQTLIEAVKNNPDISVETLRPLAERFIPSYSFADAKFCDNLRRRIENFLMKKGMKAQVTEQDATEILKKTRISAAEEYIDTDDPLVKDNIKELLRMSLSSSHSWQALFFLDKIKERNPNFDYRVMKDPNNGTPLGILVMDESMRESLLRYGHLWSLDAQKCKFNRVAWVLIAPVGRDNEMRIVPFCEGLFLAENLESYVFVIQSVREMEPRFELSNIKILFGDKFITEEVLRRAGILETCTLRCDFYHMLEHITKDNFGQHLHPLIREDLKTMLKGPRYEWESSYENILQHVQGDASKTQYLMEIYNNPRYYAGWYLRNIHLNINIKGTQSSEAYHASIKKAFGKCKNWSISTHLCKLREHQINWRNRMRNQDIKYSIKIRKFKSSMPKDKINDDVLAKETLSKYAYSNLWCKEIRAANSYKKKNMSDGTVAIVPSNDNPDNRLYGECWIITPDTRCTCERRIMFGIQCRHELVFDEKLIVSKFHHRWYLRSFYQQRMLVDTNLLNINMVPVEVARDNNNQDQRIQQLEVQDNNNNDRVEIINEEDRNEHVEAVEEEEQEEAVNEGEQQEGLEEEQDDDGDEVGGIAQEEGNASDDDGFEDEQEDDATLSQQSSKKHKLTFTYGLEKASNLIRLVQYDQVKFAEVLNLLDEIHLRVSKYQSI